MALQEATASSSTPAPPSSSASPAFPTTSHLDLPSPSLPSPLGAPSAGPAPDTPSSPRFSFPRASSPAPLPPPLLPSVWARVERTINSLCHNRWLGLICGLWLLACAGSSATFAIYSPALKAVGGYNQRQVDGLAVAKDMGESVGLLPGLLCDALPVWALVLVGSLHYLVGFSGLFAVATHRILPLPFWQMCGLMLVGSQGTAWFNTAVLVTCVRNFPRSRGSVVGLLKGVVGLSGAIFTQVYAALIAPDQAAYLGFIAVVPPLVSLPAMTFLRPSKRLRAGHCTAHETERDVRRREEHEGQTLHTFLVIALGLAAYLLLAMLLHDGNSSQQFNRGILAGMVSFLLLPLATFLPPLFPSSSAFPSTAPTPPSSTTPTKSRRPSGGDGEAAGGSEGGEGEREGAGRGALERSESYDSLLSDISRVSSLADLQSYFAQRGGGASGMPMGMGMGMGGAAGGGGAGGGASGAYWGAEGSSSMGGAGSSGSFVAGSSMGGSSMGAQQGGWYAPPGFALAVSALSPAPPRARPIFSPATSSPPTPAFSLGVSPPVPPLALAPPIASSSAAPPAAAPTPAPAAPAVPASAVPASAAPASAAPASAAPASAAPADANGAPPLRSPVGLAAALAPASQRFSSLRPSDPLCKGASPAGSAGAGGAGDALRAPLLAPQEKEEWDASADATAAPVATATATATAPAAGPSTLRSPPATTAPSRFPFLSLCLPTSCWPFRRPAPTQPQQQHGHHHHTEEERRRKQAELLLAVGEGAVRVGGGRRRSGPRRGQDFTLQQAAVKADFWLLFVSFLCGTGSGLTAINNLAQMGTAQGYSSVRVFLSLLSVSNFVGRLLAGYASEHVVKEHVLPRPVLLLMAQSLMAVGHVFFALAFPTSLHLGSVIVGLSYGVHWSIMPATASELFGLKHFGMLYNTLTAACPFGSFVFSGLIAGYLYDREAEKDHSSGGGPGVGGASSALAHTASASDTLSRRILRSTSQSLTLSSSSSLERNVSSIGSSSGLHVAEWAMAAGKSKECYGAHCFRLTFFIMAAVCVLGVCLNLILIMRTRVVYTSLYAKPDAKAQKEEQEVRAAAREVVSAAAAAARRVRVEGLAGRTDQSAVQCRKT
ncbi:hypothetical protein CLOM_g24133 [Closterium sp. NIES-68]|nr:hypothetical protein CLOM_g24133 [Closterium sp. NIES-68]GJP84671.1 hypothetical protein CLOP_g14715 [Closterium sp. NIES-67]